MSACDTCPKPGSCCKGFTLNNGRSSPGFPASDWMARGIAYADRHHLPFIPLETYESTVEGSDDGYVGIRWQCKNLTPEGRCGDYENRPELCRIYEPGQDKLCAVYVEPVTEDQL
jgi:Fe-S-cluster containining protein